ncbi:hypothetical protein HHI36_000066 [Cryptolaemus montrouzieri]|uniref:Uncharacterized protein n=1 Tax=Cryptolaemus montrouzieri TaxID=559131 RepID=A0ABD2P3L2_9CUCU
MQHYVVGTEFYGIHITTLENVHLRIQYFMRKSLRYHHQNQICVLRNKLLHPNTSNTRAIILRSQSSREEEERSQISLRKTPFAKNTRQSLNRIIICFLVNLIYSN